MRQLSVLVSVLVVIMVVIFSSAQVEEVTGYLNQSVFQGQSVIVNDYDEAYVNNEPVDVIHTGFTYTTNFRVVDSLLINGMDSLLIDHNSEGALGKPAYIFKNISSAKYGIGDNLHLDDWELEYNGSFRTESGAEMYVYKYGNMSVGVSVEDFTVIQDNGRALLLNQAGGSVTVSEIEQPFDMGWSDLSFLIGILAIVGIVGFWLMREKKDWKFRSW